MKKYVVILAVAITLVLVLTDTPTASARYIWEDPQLCVNGELLTVLPTAPAEVFVSVPDDANVDFNVADCGGSDKVIPPDHVSYDGKNKLTVMAITLPKADVLFSYDSKSVDRKAVGLLAMVRFDLP